MPTKKKRPQGTLIMPGQEEAGLIKLYAYQDEDLTAKWRMMAAMQARQTGKTFGISAEAIIICCLLECARCVTLSASLRQGALNIQKDAEVWRTIQELMRGRVGQDSKLKEFDASRRLLTSPADDDKGRLIDIDAISDLMENGRLETRVYKGTAAGAYSSHQIFAANPDTARGATADRLFWDEFGTTPEFKEVMRAVKHMISRRPNARFKLKGTPPISSDHESWEMFYDEQTYAPNARGNWRRSNAPNGQGIPILRVDAYDAEIAGIKTYDDVTGDPIAVAEKIERSTDKEGDERELLLGFGSSGNAKIPYSCLTRAQNDSTGGGEALDLGVISHLDALSDEGLRNALRNLIPATWVEHCTKGDELGFGHDQSTSDKTGVSNPSSFSVIQEHGIRRHKRLVVRWLSRFPRLNDALIKLVLDDSMRAQMRLRGMGIDASNETFNAQRLASLFGHLLPVGLYKNGEKHPTANMAWKDHLASQYAQRFLDGLMTLPKSGKGKSAEWVLSDHSLAVNGPNGVEWRTSKGNHADTFCSGMLAEEILTNGSGPVEVTNVRASTMLSEEWESELDDDEGLISVERTDDRAF